MGTMYACSATTGFGRLLGSRDPRHRSRPDDVGLQTCIKPSCGAEFVRQIRPFPRARQNVQMCPLGGATHKVDVGARKPLQTELAGTRYAATASVLCFSPQTRALGRVERATSRPAALLQSREEPASRSHTCASQRSGSVWEGCVYDTELPGAKAGHNHCTTCTDKGRAGLGAEQSAVGGYSSHLQRAQKTVPQVHVYRSKKLTHPSVNRSTLQCRDLSKGVQQRKGLQSGLSLFSGGKTGLGGGPSLRGQPQPSKSGRSSNLYCSVSQKPQSQLHYKPCNGDYRCATRDVMNDTRPSGVPSLDGTELDQPLISKQQNSNDAADARSRCRLRLMEIRFNVGAEVKARAPRAHSITDKRCKLVPCKTGPLRNIGWRARSESYSRVCGKEKRSTGPCRARSTLDKENCKRETTQSPRMVPHCNAVKDLDKGPSLRESRLQCSSKPRRDPSKSLETRRQPDCKECRPDLTRLSCRFASDSMKGGMSSDKTITRTQSASRRPPNVPKLDLRRCKEYRIGV